MIIAHAKTQELNLTDLYATDTDFRFGYLLGQIDAALGRDISPKMSYLCDECGAAVDLRYQNCRACGFELFPF